MGYKTKLLVGFLLSFGILFLTTCKKNSTGSNEPNQSPTVTFSVTTTEGIMPHEVTVKVDGSDTDGSIASYHFDADGDGTAEITQSSPIDQSYTYETEGTYSAKAWVSDDEGADSQQETVQVIVETNKPIFTLEDQSLDLVEGQRVSFARSDLVRNGTIIEATVQQGPVTVELDADSLYLSGGDFAEASQSYELDLQAENEHGITSTTLSASVEGRADVSGSVMTAVSGEPLEAMVEFWSGGEREHSVQTDGQGNYNTQLPGQLKGDIKVKAYAVNSESYTRTLSRQADQGDLPEIDMTVNLTQPYRDAGLTPAEGREFIRQVKFTQIGQGNGDGYRVPAQKETVLIIPYNPETDEYVPEDEQEDIREIVDEINECLGMDYEVEVAEEGDYSNVGFTDLSVHGLNGYVTITRHKDNPFSAVLAFDEEADGVIGTITGAGVGYKRMGNTVREDLYQGLTGTKEPENTFGHVSFLPQTQSLPDPGVGDCVLIPGIIKQEIAPMQSIGNVLGKVRGGG